MKYYKKIIGRELICFGIFREEDDKQILGESKIVKKSKLFDVEYKIIEIKWDEMAELLRIHNKGINPEKFEVVQHSPIRHNLH